MTTIVKVERFKRGGSQKFYDDFEYSTKTAVYDVRELEKEVREIVDMKGFTFTIEAKSDQQWNKYLIY